LRPGPGCFGSLTCYQGCQLGRLAAQRCQRGIVLERGRSKRRRDRVQTLVIAVVTDQSEQRAAERRLDQILDQLTARRARLGISALQPIGPFGRGWT
jgi:hypothetical protein